MCIKFLSIDSVIIKVWHIKISISYRLAILWCAKTSNYTKNSQ